MSRSLKEGLTTLINDVHSKYQSRIKNASKPDEKYFQLWKKRMTSEVLNMRDARASKRSRTITKGLQDLKNMDIVLKAADKNLGIVAIRKDIYNHLLNKHLSPPCFKQVTTFPHQNIVTRLENILTHTTLIPTWCKSKWLKEAQTAKEPCPFYIIPKIHKRTLGARPITAQHSYMLKSISKHLASILQITADSISEIAKDSKTVVQQVEQLNLHGKEFVFVTYDVEACYPNIDINDAIRTLYENIPIMRSNNAVLSRLLRLVMFNNYVTCNERIYRQMTGTATGTQVAPPFANLYLFYKFKQYLPPEHLLFQSRYIDDGLLITQDIPTGKKLIQDLQQASNLNLTFDISKQKAIYLDLELFKGTRLKRQGKLDIRVYFKPTNRQLYLPAISHHPGSHKSGIIRGEAIRCLRNCSDKGDWLNALAVIFKGLINRGYQPSLIQTQWKKVRYEDRQRYITESPEHTKPEGTLTMTTFHPKLKVHWKALLAKYPITRYLLVPKRGRYNKKQREILADWPPRVIFRDFNKIGRKVYHAKEITETFET